MSTPGLVCGTEVEQIGETPVLSSARGGAPSCLPQMPLPVSSSAAELRRKHAPWGHANTRWHLASISLSECVSRGSGITSLSLHLLIYKTKITNLNPQDAVHKTS